MQDDDIELPEFTEEIRNEIIASRNTDLHLGAAEVKKHDYIDWYVKKYGPKPIGIGIRSLDVLIVILFFVCCDLLVISWLHAFS